MPLQVSVVTPEREVWGGEADFVLARSAGGDVGILPGHAPFLGALGYARLIVTSGGGQTFIATDGGFIEVLDDRVTVLTSSASLAEEIDVEEARRRKAEAEAALARGEDTPEVRQALLRWTGRLATAAEAGLIDVG